MVTEEKQNYKVDRHLTLASGKLGQTHTHTLTLSCANSSWDGAHTRVKALQIWPRCKCRPQSGSYPEHHAGREHRLSPAEPSHRPPSAPKHSLVMHSLSLEEKVKPAWGRANRSHCMYCMFSSNQALPLWGHRTGVPGHCLPSFNSLLHSCLSFSLIGFQTSAYLDKSQLAQENPPGWRVRRLHGNKRECIVIWGLRMRLKLVARLTSAQKPICVGFHPSTA